MTTWDRESLTSVKRRPLYGEFYGLNEAPFELTPNPRFLYLSHRQREALSNLRYALATSKGFALILGEAGTGKTTLVRTALGELGPNQNRYALISNPTLGREEFYELLSHHFGFSPEASRSKTRFLFELEKDLESRAAVGGLTGLIIDEAQSLPHELLEEIRLLGNIETATSKLLNVVLCGQPELADRLNDPSLRQLKQRMALRCELTALTLDETAAYISGRLRIAGGSPGQIFTRETVIAIHEASAGIPRTINVLSDNALIGGFAAQLKPIPAGIIVDLCREFDIELRTEPPPLPPATRRVSTPPASRRPADQERPTQAITSGSAARPMVESLATRRRSGRFSFFS